MKKYFTEMIIILIQIIFFTLYSFHFYSSFYTAGMASFTIAIALGLLSRYVIKITYPLVALLLFLLISIITNMPIIPFQLIALLLSTSLGLYCGVYLSDGLHEYEWY